eukprot:g19578.t1
MRVAFRLVHRIQPEFIVASEVVGYMVKYRPLCHLSIGDDGLQHEIPIGKQLWRNLCEKTGEGKVIVTLCESL